ncbi:hypothetical protein GCM10011391_13260 [Pullulanibacillus camelliae]|uniref:Uncharacterized protein n=1 Tax=Pullulanibacillus camelliae TaxID=1707096 RepID=A0A8J2VL87_9BACL|nr:hypothetical protein [Pullulanibacillus camelliae]GGE35835.1 hypothetical protein GCM10011391_13260 [Pullulanibacillus camelliae]
MSEHQRAMLNHIREVNQHIENLVTDYWKAYSGIDTWQFWLNAVLLIIPLVFLLIYIDRRRVFQILFFGYTIHVLMNYLDITAVLKGLMYHPYSLLPMPQSHLTLDASLIPVAFMLTYQLGYNRRINQYLLAVVIGAVMSFIFGPIVHAIGFLKMYHWMSYWVLFIGDIIEYIIAYWLTSFFFHFYRNDEPTS